jgi:tellurite resistance protein TerC
VATIGTPALWAGFSAFVVITLALDLGIFHRRAHEVRTREALRWTLAWISLAVVFGSILYAKAGSDRALEFFTGYLIEYALSVDNLFVFLVVFAYFGVPKSYQHRVLFWGILGAVVARGIFIGAGAALLSAFDWIIYVFGGFLIYTGIRLLRGSDEEVHPERNPVLRAFRRIVPIVPRYEGARFVVQDSGRRHATLLLCVLVALEATDIVFAVDSIPAIFAITRDPFIVYTSNIFAILGLRSLFFLLAGMMGRFHYLNVALALVLTFIGGKMLASNFVHIPIGASLAVVATLLGGGVAASLLRPKRPIAAAPAPAEPSKTPPEQA